MKTVNENEVEVTLNGERIQGWGDCDPACIGSPLKRTVLIRNPRVVPCVAIYEGDAHEPRVSFPLKDEVFVKHWQEMRQLAVEAHSDNPEAPVLKMEVS